jgi:hypothetical protein
VFDVGAITPAAPAALAEIKAQVAADWARAQQLPLPLLPTRSLLPWPRRHRSTLR